MTHPIQITEAAVLHIKSMIAKHPGGLGFRLSVKKTGCSGLAYLPNIIEKTVETDLHFTAAHDLNVYIDPQCLDYIKGVMIDYVTQEGAGLKQKRLVFINPNEKGRCGCGESFTIE